MGQVQKERLENLKGYRNPTENEKQKIYDYMQSDLHSRRKQMKFFRSIIVCFAVAMTAGCFLKIFEAINNYGEIIIGVMIALILWGVFVALHKSLVTNRILELHVKNGNYQVLDCIPYEHHYAQDSTRTEGSVQIQTKEGVLCRGNFVVDIETALLCESSKGKGLPLLLLYEKETKESRVFSERMLNRR